MELSSLGVIVAVFCRIGCCFMVLPGLASSRMPQLMRLLLVGSFSLAVGPILADVAIPRTRISFGAELVLWLGMECVVGFAFGLLARIIFAAAQAAGNLIPQVSGYGHAFSSDDGHGEPTSELAVLISSSVVVTLFVLDFHHMVIASLIGSYDVICFGGGSDAALGLDRLVAAAADSFRLAVGISAPFVVASLAVNLAFGMLNRIAPQIPVFVLSAVFSMSVMLWFGAALMPEFVLALFQATVLSLARL